MGFVSDITLVNSLFSLPTSPHQISHHFQKILPFKHTPHSISTMDNLIYGNLVGVHSSSFWCVGWKAK